MRLTQAFIQAFLSTAAFYQRFSFFTVWLLLSSLSLWGCLKVRSPYCCKVHFWHSFWLQYSERWIVEWNGKSFKSFEHMKRFSFVTEFKIEFLLPFASCRKVLRKMPVTELPDTHMHFTTTSWSCVTKDNIQKLNLCSKTDISETAWIKPATGTFAVKFSVKLLPANKGFVNYSRLKFSQIFRTLK